MYVFGQYTLKKWIFSKNEFLLVCQEAPNQIASMGPVPPHILIIHIPLMSRSARAVSDPSCSSPRTLKAAQPRRLSLVSVCMGLHSGAACACVLCAVSRDSHASRSRLAPARSSSRKCLGMHVWGRRQGAMVMMLARITQGVALPDVCPCACTTQQVQHSSALLGRLPAWWKYACHDGPSISGPDAQRIGQSNGR